jgi:hypothetical protein
MKQKKNKSKNVKLIQFFQAGSFPPMIMFSVGFSYNQIINHLKKMKAKEWISGLEGEKEFINKNKYIAMHREMIDTKTERHAKDLYYIIFTEPFIFTDYSYSILAHEVLHCTQFLLEPILDIKKEYEAFAYTHTFIMDKCMELIRGNKKT